MSNYSDDEISPVVSIKQEVTFEEEVIFEEVYDLDVIIKEEEFETEPFRKKRTRSNKTSDATGGKCRCEVCGKAFQFPAYLKRHMASHGIQRNFKCDLCDKTFKFASNVIEHKKLVHTTDKPFRCEVCSKYFVTLDQLRKHFKKHNRGFKCHLCPKGFSSRHNLNKHKDSVHYGKKFDCDLCDKTQLTITEEDDTSEKPFRCEVCSKRFAKAKYLSKHSKIHDEGYQCDLCPSAFNSKHRLTKHKILVHSENKFNCGQCGETFKSYHLLTSHKSNEHATGKPYRCEVCPKRFATLSLLKYHTRGHARQIRCDQCQSVFSSPENVDIHKFFVHGATKIDQNRKRLRCEMCAKTFSSLPAFRRHVTAHGDEKNFNCDHCCRMFKLKRDSAAREKKAPSRKRFLRCEVCPKTFATARLLKIHSSKQHDFSCNVCGRKFTRLHEFREHLASHAATGAEENVIYVPETEQDLSNMDADVKQEQEEVESVSDVKLEPQDIFILP